MEYSSSRLDVSLFTWIYPFTTFTAFGPLSPCSISKVTRSPSAKVLNPDPEFTWQPVENTQSYRFILSDDLGLTMADITVEEGSSLELPEDVKLDEGVDYTWEVVAHLPAETEYRALASFSVLEASTREHVEAARPGPGASFAERAVYARMLERLDLKMAAIKIWQELALLRPEQKSLQQRIHGKSEG